MLGRMNMSKQVANAPGSKGVKKMLGGGMASMPMPGGGNLGKRPMPMPGKRPMPMPGSDGPGISRGGPAPMPGGMPQESYVGSPSRPVRGMPSMPPVIMGPAPKPVRDMSQRGGPGGMAKGGMVKGYAKGGSATRADGCCMKGKTKGKMV